MPDYCIAMPRSPEPPTGARFDKNFLDIVDSVQSLNPAIHDGAIIVVRDRPSDDYVVVGWSYRLIAPFISRFVSDNRGSAYNSALSMSLVPNVDAVALIAHGTLELFSQGQSAL